MPFGDSNGAPVAAPVPIGIRHFQLFAFDALLFYEPFGLEVAREAYTHTRGVMKVMIGMVID